MGIFSSLFRRDQKAMPDPDSPEFQQMVSGSALPGSVEMGQPEWVKAGEVAPGVPAGGAPAGGGAAAVTPESLIAAGVPPEQAAQTAAALGQLQQAFGGGGVTVGGDVTVSQGPPQTLDLTGMQELRDEMMATLRQYGVDPDSGESFDTSQVAGLQEAVLQVLTRHGVDVSQMGGQQT